jgi:hypothetical protein
VAAPLAIPRSEPVDKPHAPDQLLDVSRRSRTPEAQQVLLVGRRGDASQSANLRNIVQGSEKACQEEAAVSC